MKFLGLLLFLCVVAQNSLAERVVTGTATYRERMALPADAVFEALVEDISRADAPAEVIGRFRIETPGHPPIRFEIPCDEARILQNHTYNVRARILSDNRLLFVTDRSYPVLTRGHGQEVALLMRQVGGKRQAKAAARDQILGSLPATFSGNLPCADCSGIGYQLDLFPDHVFFLRMAYLDKDRSVDDIGVWTVSSDGRTLHLKGGHEAPTLFAIKNDGKLRKLDIAGHQIQSTFNYDLTRNASQPVIEPRIPMRGMYRYMADAGLFTECLTRRRMPVATEQDNAALETAYGKLRRQPGEEILASVEGRIASRPKIEGDGPQTTLIVERFIGLWPGEACGAQFAAAKLENTYWKLTRLGDRPVIAGEQAREPHFVLHADGRRVKGFSGCNRITGHYEWRGNELAFSRIVSTKMACPSGEAVEKPFLEALNQITTWKITGEHLELFDTDGKLLARFEAIYLR